MVTRKPVKLMIEIHDQLMDSVSLREVLDYEQDLKKSNIGGKQYLDYL